jgi:hypothetical protein
MLRISIIINSSLPLFALFLDILSNIQAFYILFLLNGSAISAHKIAYEGVLIQISNEANRPLYTGIFGTLNLTAILFPILTGNIFVNFGYVLPFLLFPAVTLSALLFVNRMICPVDLEK